MNDKGNIQKAHRQFLQDLQSDADFKEFKKNCISEPGHSYGIVIAGTRRFVIDENNINHSNLVVMYERERIK